MLFKNGFFVYECRWFVLRLAILHPCLGEFTEGLVGCDRGLEHQAALPHDKRRARDWRRFAYFPARKHNKSNVVAAAKNWPRWEEWRRVDSLGGPEKLRRKVCFVSSSRNDFTRTTVNYHHPTTPNCVPTLETILHGRLSFHRIADGLTFANDNWEIAAICETCAEAGDIGRVSVGCVVN